MKRDSRASLTVTTPLSEKHAAMDDLHREIFGGSDDEDLSEEDGGLHGYLLSRGVIYQITERS